MSDLSETKVTPEAIKKGGLSIGTIVSLQAKLILGKLSGPEKRLVEEELANSQSHFSTSLKWFDDEMERLDFDATVESKVFFDQGEVSTDRNVTIKIEQNFNSYIEVNAEQSTSSVFVSSNKGSWFNGDVGLRVAAFFAIAVGIIGSLFLVNGWFSGQKNQNVVGNQKQQVPIPNPSSPTVWVTTQPTSINETHDTKRSFQIGMIVPAYYDIATKEGDTAWTVVRNIGKGSNPLRMIVIINPSNGPGDAKKPLHDRRIRESTADEDETHYFKAIGYVECDGRESEEGRREISRAVDRWVLNYPHIRGIYFHSHDAKKTAAPAWAKIFNESKQKILAQRKTAFPIIISNPSSNWSEEFYTALRVEQDAPSIVCFEDEIPSGNRIDTWPKNHSAIELAAIIHEHTTDPDAEGKARVKELMEAADSAHLSWFYISCLLEDSIPNYILYEANEFRKLNDSTRDFINKANHK